MTIPSNKVLRESARIFGFGALFKIAINRINHYIAKKNIESYPQLAILAFDHIGLSINLNGRYENDLLCLIGDFIKEIISNSNEKIALDIGANIGNHSLYFSELFKEIYAFEPNPYTFSLLKINAEFACPKNNIKYRNYGLSNVDKNLMFRVNRDNIGGGSIVVKEDFQLSAESFLIEVKPLDQINELSDKEIALIKIDVEGHELAVLEGGEILLRKNRPLILFEQSGIEINDGSSATINYLKDLNYEFAVVKRNFSFGRFPFLKIISFLLRAIFGAKSRITKVQYFEKKHYDLIVAIPRQLNI